MICRFRGESIRKALANGLMVAVVLCNKGVCFRKGNGNKH